MSNNQHTTYNLSDDLKCNLRAALVTLDVRLVSESIKRILDEQTHHLDTIIKVHMKYVKKCILVADRLNLSRSFLQHELRIEDTRLLLDQIDSCFDECRQYYTSKLDVEGFLFSTGDKQIELLQTCYESTRKLLPIVEKAIIFYTTMILQFENNLNPN